MPLIYKYVVIPSAASTSIVLVKAESYRVHRRRRVRELVGVESIQRDTDEKIGVLWDAEVGSSGYRRVINQGKPSRS